jgi:hypothetical protein
MPLQQRRWTTSPWARVPRCASGVPFEATPSAGRGRGPRVARRRPPPLEGEGVSRRSPEKVPEHRRDRPSPAFGVGLSTGCVLNFEGSVLWSGSRTRDRRFIRPLLYPLSYPTAGGSPGTRTRLLSKQPLVTRIRCSVRCDMCGTDGRIRMPRTGGVGFHPSPWPVSIRL